MAEQNLNEYILFIVGLVVLGPILACLIALTKYITWFLKGKPSFAPPNYDNLYGEAGQLLGVGLLLAVIAFVVFNRL